MTLGRLNHVGVATPSIEQSLEMYRTMFGAEPHGEPFDLPAQGVRVCFVDTPCAGRSNGAACGSAPNMLL